MVSKLSAVLALPGLLLHEVHSGSENGKTHGARQAEAVVRGEVAFIAGEKSPMVPVLVKFSGTTGLR